MSYHEPSGLQDHLLALADFAESNIIFYGTQTPKMERELLFVS